MSEQPTPRRDEASGLRRSAVLLGLQTGLAVALIVMLLVGVALVVVLRAQHEASTSLVRSAVRTADDVVDPPQGTWLVIKTPSKVVSSRGLPTGFPDQSALAANSGAVGQFSNSRVAGVDYLIYTQQRDGVTIQGILDLSANHAERARLVGALGLAGVLGLVLAVLLGTALAFRAMKPLASALALQRRFVSEASHDLRTPLTLISTRAQLIQRGLRRNQDAASLATDIDGLVLDADNLALIFDDLLIAADPRRQSPEESVDLDSLAREVVEAYQPQAREMSIDIVSVAAPGPVLIVGSPGALRRAVAALIDNALRHAQSKVTVTAEINGNRASLEVTDDGAGIDVDLAAATLRSIPVTGEPTARLQDDPETGQREPQRRYGLGLALVSEVARRNHGEVSARNGAANDPQNGGAGATLKLSFPRSR